MRISDWSSDVCSSDLVPDRAEAVRLHGVDARASAEDEGASGQVQGRQAPPAAGDAEALSGGEGQSAGRLPADPAPDPHLLRALQGADADDRDAPLAVRAVDQGSVRARSADAGQPVWPVAVHEIGRGSCREIAGKYV